LSVLTSYGITPDTMEVPMLATTDIVKLGQLPKGLPVYTNKIVSSLDGLIIVNRIKSHTSFKSNIESGLCKILAVGFGNHKGASLVHSLGVKGLSEYLVKIAEIVLREIPVLCGLEILENGYDKT
jgi:hypothetical protein